MGNHAKRQSIAALLRGRGLGPLYRGNKKVAWRMLQSFDLKILERRLRWRPGDLVNDCDLFNHEIKKIVDLYYRTSSDWLKNGRGASILSIDQFEFADGTWSCGCSGSPTFPWTRERIETKYREYLITVAKNEQDYYERIRVALDEGRPICDERGIRLPEFPP